MKYIYELILGNYARCTYLLHSHISGKFVSDFIFLCMRCTYYGEVSIPQIGEICIRLTLVFIVVYIAMFGFNPLDRGNLYQMQKTIETQPVPKMFQSPRSGKFVSDIYQQRLWKIFQQCCFNPLDRGNLYQIQYLTIKKITRLKFQSPRSGKFVSDMSVMTRDIEAMERVSIPQIGEICIRYEDVVKYADNFNPFVSIPQIGEICIRF